MAVVYDTAQAKSRIVYDDDQPVAPPAPAAAAPKAPAPLGGAYNLLGGLETLAHVGSSMGAGPIAGLRGMAAGQLGGLGGKDPTEVIEDTADQLTYKPQTQWGQGLSKAVTAIPAKIGELLARGGDWAGEKVTDITGSPGAGALTNAGLQVAPAAFTKALGKPAKEWSDKTAHRLLTEEFVNAPRDMIMEQARAKGMAALPAAVNPTLINRVSQGLAGESRLEGRLSMSNQTQGNTWAREALGIGETTPFLSGVRQKLYQATSKEEIAEYRNLLKAIDPVSQYLDMQKLGRLFANGRPIPEGLVPLAKFAHENTTVVQLPKAVKGGAMSLTDLGMGGLAAYTVKNPYYLALNLARPGMRAAADSPLGKLAVGKRTYDPPPVRQAIANALMSPGTSMAAALAQASQGIDTRKKIQAD